jgi:hypothetical protein
MLGVAVDSLILCAPVGRHNDHEDYIASRFRQSPKPFRVITQLFSCAAESAMRKPPQGSALPLEPDRHLRRQLQRIVRRRGFMRADRTE